MLATISTENTDTSNLGTNSADLCKWGCQLYLYHQDVDSRDKGLLRQGLFVMRGVIERHLFFCPKGQLYCSLSLLLALPLSYSSLESCICQLQAFQPAQDFDIFLSPSPR